MTENEDALIKIQIRHLTDAVTELKNEIKDFRNDLKTGYVSKETYNNLKEDVDSLLKSRALVLTLMFTAFLSGMIGMLFTTGALK